MKTQRTLSWSSAMRDLRHERPAIAEIREEPLRAAGSLNGPLHLSSWRGRSGRRYVVSVEAWGDVERWAGPDSGGAIWMAVRRDRDGSGQLVDVVGDADETARMLWLWKAEAEGATEIHVHRLAQTIADRRFIMSDLL